MISILLSITIWLRKFQGRGGNYYTIGNAASIMCVFGYLAIFLMWEQLNPVLGFKENIITSSLFIFPIFIAINVYLVYRLMYKLKAKKIYLRYKTYQVSLFFSSLVVLIDLVIFFFK